METGTTGEKKHEIIPDRQNMIHYFLGEYRYDTCEGPAVSVPAMARSAPAMGSVPSAD
jgi:hypothetical protein